MPRSSSRKFQRGREVALEIARKGVRVLRKGLSVVPAALGVVNLVRNEEAASLAHTVLTAFVEMWNILRGLLA